MFSIRRLSRVSSVTLGSVLIAATLVSGSAGAAFAAPPPACVGVQCNGLSPFQIVGVNGSEATACIDDAEYVAPASLPDGYTVWLVYSPSCQANWAELTSGPDSTPFYVHNTAGNFEWGTYDGTPSGTNWTYTPMVNGQVAAQACLYDSSGSNCTGWY